MNNHIINVIGILVLLVCTYGLQIKSYTIRKSTYIHHSWIEVRRQAQLGSSVLLQNLNADDVDVKSPNSIGSWLIPNTRGRMIIWGGVLLIIPLVFYLYFVNQGMDETSVGAYVGAIFVLLSNLLWASTYVFRVANKDMTYAKQLRDYENSVLQKRLDELNEEEIIALTDEVDNADSVGEVSV